MFEIVFRAALIYSNLMQSTVHKVSRSEAYDVLDPSEKSAVSYFLGLTFAKLFAEEFLDVPWLMHLDVYRDRLHPHYVSSRSKPDLIGHDANGDWYVIEAKGRTGGRDNVAMNRAKQQTQSLSSISGKIPSLRVALVCYFKNNELEVAWEDPDGYDEEPFSVEMRAEDLLYRYYKPFADFLDSGEGELEVRSVRDRTYLTKYVGEADLRVGMSQAAHRAASDPAFEMNIANLSPRASNDLPENTTIGRDGIYVELGSSWSSEKMARQPTLRDL